MKGTSLPPSGPSVGLKPVGEGTGPVKPSIYIDVDGTLVNFVKQYARFHKRATGKDIQWENVEHYDLTKSMPTERQYEYLYDVAFYEDIDFFPSAVEVINLLKQEGYDIKFMTTCVTFESMIAKFHLLARTFKWFEIEKHWIVLSRKQHFVTPNSIMIDDNPHFFKETKFTYNICHALKHNEHVHHLVSLRTHDWKQIYGFIKAI